MIFEKRDEEIYEGLSTLNVIIFMMMIKSMEWTNNYGVKANVSDAITVGTFKLTGRGLKAKRDIRKGT